MAIEIAIPVILCVMAGVFVALWYLWCSGRISRPTCLGGCTVALIVCLPLAWMMYQQDKENKLLAAQSTQQLAAQLQNLDKTADLTGYTASSLLGAGRISPEHVASQMQGKEVVIRRAYLVGATGSGASQVFILSDKPEAFTVNGESFYFFGLAKEASLVKKMQGFPKGTPLKVSAVFAGFDKINKNNGGKVGMFIINIHDVESEA